MKAPFRVLVTTAGSFRDSAYIRTRYFDILAVLLTATLRLETRTHHDRIEERLGLPHRVTTPEEYVALLIGFYGFYASVEPKLQALLTNAPQFRITERQKLNLLHQDLAALGWSKEAIAAIPLCDASPSLNSISEALGCLYVLEGSTLGGQVISAHFGRELSITIDTGGRYFHGYGSATAALWRGFKEALLAYSEQYPEQDESIIAAAGATFESLEAWLCR